ncbi:MAG: hypothetical protein H0T64_11800 [Pyrinomonadaceae bacterium]|nr:hypothetical protein [Pyrinomonadaceae bacterium]
MAGLNDEPVLNGEQALAAPHFFSRRTASGSDWVVVSEPRAVVTGSSLVRTGSGSDRVVLSQLGPGRYRSPF